MNHRDLFSELHKVRRIEPVQVETPKSITLRPYQQEAVNGAFHKWDEGHKSVLIQLPTGCGKSVVFSEVMRRCAGK